jgi:hypothetical protein
MPGNLFLAGGVLYVAIGGFLWALLLGWIDRLKVSVPAAAAAGLQAVFGIQAMAGIERDYAHAFSTVVQTLIVTVGVMAIVGSQFASKSKPRRKLDSLDSQRRLTRTGAASV